MGSDRYQEARMEAWDNYPRVCQELRLANERIAEWNELARKKDDEIDALRKQIANAIELITEMKGYVSDYFRDKWDFDKRIDALITKAEKP